MMSQQTINQLPAIVRLAYGEDAVIDTSYYMQPHVLTGYTVKLWNGWNVGVDCGPGTYSSNRDISTEIYRHGVDSPPFDGFTALATTAQVGVFMDKDRYHIFKDGSKSAHYQTIEEIMEIIATFHKLGVGGLE